MDATNDAIGLLRWYRSTAYYGTSPSGIRCTWYM